MDLNTCPIISYYVHCKRTFLHLNSASFIFLLHSDCGISSSIVISWPIVIDLVHLLITGMYSFCVSMFICHEFGFSDFFFIPNFFASTLVGLHFLIMELLFVVFLCFNKYDGVIGKSQLLSFISESRRLFSGFFCLTHYFLFS